MTTIISWNVNGLRAALKSRFMEWLLEAQPDIVCIQESRVHPGELAEELLTPAGYSSFWNPAQKKGYSGTAAYVKTPPVSVGVLGVDEFDVEGRLQVLEYPKFSILNGYWPNSQAKRARLDYKLAYCNAVTHLANGIVAGGKHVVLCGDFNIAHEAIDLARPKDNENNPGYYIEEREAMTRFINNGYVDIYRQQNPDSVKYSWWSYRTKARDRNIGWRIDYCCVNKALAPKVKEAFILNEVLGSDHCPVGIELDIKLG